MLAVLCALGASVLYAGASVFQHRASLAEPADQSLRLGLLVRLVRRPIWLLGLACDGGGYVLQFIALGHGPIVVVQLLLVCGLLFALPIGAAWAGRSQSRSDWVAAALLCAGLATFLLVANPATGRDDIGTGRWVVLLVTSSAVALALTAWGRVSGPRRRAVLYSSAAGIVYGAAAALTKTTSSVLTSAPLHVITNWQTYVLVVFGVAGMVLAQSAFQAGALDLSLPTLTVADPVASIVIGAAAFGESIASTALPVTVEAVALVAMVIGVYVLARSDTKVAAAPVAGSA